MKKNLIAFVPFALLLSAQAFAWGGDGHLPPGQKPMPVDVGGASTVQPGLDNVIVKVSVNNREGTLNRICDIQAQVDAKRNFDVITVTTYVDKVEIDYGTIFDARFNFRSAQFSQGFKMLKESQRYNAACLTLDGGENPGQVPAPHTMCDPEFEQCGNTCPADSNNPNSCGAGF